MSSRKLCGNGRARSLVLLAAVVLGAGCATALPPPREPVSEDARRALALLIRRWHAFSDFRALAEIVVQQGSRRQRLTGVLLAKAPGSVRFEALSPFGQPLLLATVHEGRFVSYNVTTKEATIGPATAESTAHLLSLPLDPDDLVGVIVGRAVPPKGLRVVELQPADDNGASLRLIGRVNEERVWMDLERGVVRRLAIVGGRADALITYHRDTTGALTGFDVNASNSYLTGSVRYQNVLLDAGIDPDRFTLAVPTDAKIRSLR